MSSCNTANKQDNPKFAGILGRLDVKTTMKTQVLNRETNVVRNPLDIERQNILLDDFVRHLLFNLEALICKSANLFFTSRRLTQRTALWIREQFFLCSHVNLFRTPPFLKIRGKYGKKGSPFRESNWTLGNRQGTWMLPSRKVKLTNSLVVPFCFQNTFKCLVCIFHTSQGRQDWRALQNHVLAAWLFYHYLLLYSFRQTTLALTRILMCLFLTFCKIVLVFLTNWSGQFILRTIIEMIN